MRSVVLGLAMSIALLSPAGAETVRLYAAGSLKAAVTEVARAFEAARPGEHVVETVFGPSGLLRGRIENGEGAHVFASANMKHPRTLVEKGMASGPVRMFARNRLCAIAGAGIHVAPETLLERMLDDAVRVGTSTPKADPSGDYAFALFARAEDLVPGARAKLEAKALKLTGGPDSEPAPDGRNQYGWVMSQNKADIFLTYCTNAVLAQREVPALQVVAVPEPLAVGADYGVIVLDGAPQGAGDLARFILQAPAQAILRTYGFAAGDDTDE